jgi:hypothetical protein
MGPFGELERLVHVDRSVATNFAVRRNGAGDCRHSALHCLEQWKTKSLIQAREPS